MIVYLPLGNVYSTVVKRSSAVDSAGQSVGSRLRDLLTRLLPLRVLAGLGTPLGGGTGGGPVLTGGAGGGTGTVPASSGGGGASGGGVPVTGGGLEAGLDGGGALLLGGLLLLDLLLSLGFRVAVYTQLARVPHA